MRRLPERAAVRRAWRPGPGSLALSLALGVAGLWTVLGVAPAAAQAPSAPTQAKGRMLGDVTVGATRADDGYWPWLESYLDGRAGFEARRDQARLELSVLAGHIGALRGRWLELTRFEMEYWDVLLQSYQDSSVTPPGRQTRDSLRAERQAIQKRIRDLHDDQQRLIDDVLRGHRALRTALEAQRQRSAPRRSWLAEEAELFGEEREVLLALRLYQAAEWYEHREFDRLRQRLRAIGTDPVATLLLEAEQHRAEAVRLRGVAALQRMSAASPDSTSATEAQARAAQLRALAALRRAHGLLPANQDVRLRLVEQEVELLRVIGAKLESERVISLAGFHQYLRNYGYDPERDAGWWEGFKEYFVASVSMGPLTSFVALAGGVPGAQADATVIEQASIAQNLVALAAMVRLSRDGMILAEIRSITPEVLAQALAPRTAEGRPLAPERIRQLTRDIHEAFAELGDLRALAAGDTAAFAVRFDAPYYDRIDADQSWAEWLGDAFSVRHLATFWSSLTVAKVGGRWVTALSSADVAAAEGAGQLLRTGDWLQQGLRLDLLGQRLVATGAGARLQRALVMHQAAVASLPRGMQALNRAGELGAAIVLTGGASYLAGESGIPGAKLLVDALIEFSVPQVLADVLTRARTPVARLASRIDRMEEFVTRQRAALQQLDDALRDAERAYQASTGAVQGGTAAATKAPLPSATPQGAIEGVEHALSGARRALASGDLEEARRALVAAGRQKQKARQALDAQAKRVQLARANLNAAARVVVPARAGAPPIRESVVGRTPPSSFLDDALHGSGAPGRHLQAGDDLLRRGELKRATEQYEAARQSLRRADDVGGADVARLERALAERLALARGAVTGAEKIARIRGRTPRLNADHPLDEQRAAGAIDSVLAGTAKVLKENKVYQDGDLIVKVMDDATARAEAVAGALGREIGLDVPAAGVVTKGGRVYLVLREVPGEDLAETTLANLLVFRRDYARQRAFRAWLGDSDGHLFNMKVAPDGRLWQLDFDMASLRGTRLTHVGLPLDDQADLIRATVGFVRGSRGLPAARDPGWQGMGQAIDTKIVPYELYAWMAKMDDLVGYDDMKDVVQRIQRLAADEGRLRNLLRATGIADPEGIAKTLRERAAVLDRVLQEPTLFGRPIRTGALPGRLLVFRRSRPLALRPALALGLAA
jgi:hypothetical protein